MRKTVYIAGPYRAKKHGQWEIEGNIRQAETLSLAVWRTANAGLCPHSNNRYFEGAGPDDIWLEGDLELMIRCDATLMTPDWERSSGARAEHDKCLELGIPVFYAKTVSDDPDDLPIELKDFLNKDIKPIYQRLIVRLAKLSES